MLTTKAIEGLQATGKQFEITDGRVPGLRVRVSQDGTKAFVLLYRHRGKRRRQRAHSDHGDQLFRRMATTRSDRWRPGRDCAVG